MPLRALGALMGPGLIFYSERSEESVLLLAFAGDCVACAEGCHDKQACAERSWITIALGITSESMIWGYQVSVLNYSSVVIVVGEIVEEPVGAALCSCSQTQC